MAAPGWRAARRLLDVLAGQLLGELGVQIAVVFLATGHVLWFVALERVDIEDGANAAAVGPGDALDTDVELAAVSWVGVAGVMTGLVGLGRVGTNESIAHLRLVATVDVVGPDANAMLRVVGQAGGALVARGLAVPARVEDATVGGVGKEAVETRAVGRGDGRLHLGALAAVHRKGIGAVLATRVGIIEHEPVAAELQGGGAVLAGVVLVAALVVAEVAERVGTVIRLARAGQKRGLGGVGLAAGLDGILLLVLVLGRVGGRVRGGDVQVGRVSVGQRVCDIARLRLVVRHLAARRRRRGGGGRTSGR